MSQWSILWMSINVCPGRLDRSCILSCIQVYKFWGFNRISQRSAGRISKLYLLKQHNRDWFPHGDKILTDQQTNMTFKWLSWQRSFPLLNATTAWGGTAKRLKETYKTQTSWDQASINPPSGAGCWEVSAVGENSWNPWQQT